MNQDYTNEEWRELSAYPLYEISRQGCIRRRFDSGSGYPAGFIRKPQNRHGKLRISLHVGSKCSKPLSVAELVATAFLGNRPSHLHFVFHKDGDLANVCAGNLEWATVDEICRRDGYEWRIIPILPDYLIREDGVIVRRTPTSKGIIADICIPLKSHDNSAYGHQLIILYAPDGKKLGSHVHRLVAWAFHGAPPTKEHQAAHNDGDATHNHYKNIRWATLEENALDRVKHGTNGACENNPKASFTNIEVNNLRTRLLSSSSPKYKELANEYGVSVSTIARIKQGKSWQGLLVTPRSLHTEGVI